MAVSVHFPLYFQTLSFFIIPRFSCSCNAKCPAMRAFPHSRAVCIFIIRVCSGPLIFQRCLHLSTDLEQIGPGLLGAPQDGLHLFPLLRGQGLVLGQQVGVASMTASGVLSSWESWMICSRCCCSIFHWACRLAVSSCPMVCRAASVSAYSRTCAPENRSLPRPFSQPPAGRPRSGGPSPGPETSGAVGAPHHRSHQQQNAQNAVTVCTSGSFPRSAGRVGTA